MSGAAAPRSRPHPLTTDRDISSVAFWSRGFIERDETFAWLRHHAPVSWHPPLEVPELPPEIHGEAGFWALVRAAEVAYASQHHELFSSDQDAYGAVMFKPTVPALMLPPTFIGMDPPRHTRYRQFLSAAFTPKAIARLTGQIDDRARQVVQRVAEAGGEIDFATQVAGLMPITTLTDLIGVPDSQFDSFVDAARNWVGSLDPEVTAGADPVAFAVEQMAILREISVETVRYRRAHPSDDIASALAQAELDGRPLSPDDIASIILLLTVAGYDTTKQTISHTVVQLWRHPEQKAWLAEDFEGRIGCAIDEFVRHASAVLDFARTATADVELAGQTIRAGDKVVLFFGSANHDESVFPDPHRFDLTRPRTRHYSFGGGVHYCLGSVVAKAELTGLFRQLLSVLPDLEVGEPEPLQRHREFIHGIRHLPVRIPTPR
ncbi:MAG: cytochrome P450 [Jatrophihabitans sp.]